MNYEKKKKKWASFKKFELENHHGRSCGQRPCTVNQIHPSQVGSCPKTQTGNTYHKYWCFLIQLNFSFKPPLQEVDGQPFFSLYWSCTEIQKAEQQEGKISGPKLTMFSTGNLFAFPLVPWSLAATHFHAMISLGKLFTVWEPLPPDLDYGSLLSESWPPLQGPSFPWVKLLSISIGLISCPKSREWSLLSSCVPIGSYLFANTSLPFVPFFIDFTSPLNLKTKNIHNTNIVVTVPGNREGLIFIGYLKFQEIRRKKREWLHGWGIRVLKIGISLKFVPMSVSLSHPFLSQTK